MRSACFMWSFGPTAPVLLNSCKCNGVAALAELCLQGPCKDMRPGGIMSWLRLPCRYTIPVRTVADLEEKAGGDASLANVTKLLSAARARESPAACVSNPEPKSSRSNFTSTVRALCSPKMTSDGRYVPHAWTERHMQTHQTSKLLEEPRGVLLGPGLPSQALAWDCWGLLGAIIQVQPS